MKKLALILILFSINSNCENKFEQLYQADLPRKAKSISYFDSGKIKELVKNSWTDRIKTDTGQVYYNYEQGYSYEKHQGFMKIYDMDGKIVEEKWSKNIDGAVSQEEALIAIDVFKNNKKIKSLFDTTNETIVIYTGFNFIDKTACKPGSRCVHVFARAGKITVFAHSIIRLTDLSVPYPEYDMEVILAKQKTDSEKSNNKSNNKL